MHQHQGDSCSKLCSSPCSFSLVPEHRYNLIHEDAYRICNGLQFDFAFCAGMAFQAEVAHFAITRHKGM